jgi:hypothetical protein
VIKKRPMVELTRTQTRVLADKLDAFAGEAALNQRQVAKAVGEDLSEFARKAVRQRVQAVQARHGSPWDDLLGSVSADAPPATNQNVRKAMRSKRP